MAYSHQPMTNARFIPRSFAVGPKTFGNAPRIEWQPEQPGVTIQLEASKLQHRWAWAIRCALADRRETVKAYCERTNQPYIRTSSMLSGRVIMRLEDIAAARLHLDLGHIDPVLEELSRL
jgi:hypothetical protein